MDQSEKFNHKVEAPDETVKTTENHEVETPAENQEVKSTELETYSLKRIAPFMAMPAALIALSSLVCCGKLMFETKETKETKETEEFQENTPEIIVKTVSARTREVVPEATTRHEAIIESHIRLWGKDVSKGDMYFMYFDYFNGFNNCGETLVEDWKQYKRKHGGADKAHDKLRASYQEEYGCKIERITQKAKNAKVFNHMYSYDVVNGEVVNVKLISDVKKFYENKYKNSFDENFNKFVKSNGSKFTKKIVDNNLSEHFKVIAVGQASAESGFNESAKSNKDAVGAFQIVTNVRKSLIKIVEKNPSEFKKFQKLDRFEQDMYLYTVHFSDQYEYLDNFFEGDDKKQFEKLVENKETFRDVILPIFVTGYNQGKGRSRRLLSLLFSLHNDEAIPKYAYKNEDNSKIENLNADAIVFLLPHALKVVHSKEYVPTKNYEKQFKKNNSQYGLHGANYYFKSISSGVALTADNYIVNIALELPEKEVKTEENNENLKLPSYDEAYKIHNMSAEALTKKFVSRSSKSHYHEGKKVDAVRPDEIKSPNVKFARNGDRWEIFDEHRRRLSDHEDFFQVYKDIAEDIYNKTGQNPEITSTFRDMKTQRMCNSKNLDSYHLSDGQAIDIRRKGFSTEDQRTVARVLAKYALEGKITYRIENGKGPHWHIVLVQKKDRAEVRSYFNNKKKVDNLRVPKFANMQKTEHYDNYKLGKSITSVERGVTLRNQKTGEVIGYIPKGNSFDVVGIVNNKYCKRHLVRYEGEYGTVLISSKDVSVTN